MVRYQKLDQTQGALMEGNSLGLAKFILDRSDEMKREYSSEASQGGPKILPWRQNFTPPSRIFTPKEQITSMGRWKTPSVSRAQPSQSAKRSRATSVTHPTYR